MGSTAQDRRHPPSVLTDLGSTNGIDAPKQAMKATARQPPLNCVGVEAGPEELAASDDAVLVGGMTPDISGVLRLFLRHTQKSAQNSEIAPGGALLVALLALS